MLRRYLSALFAAAAVTAAVVPPAQAGTSGTLFGALVAPKHGEGFANAVNRQDAAYGRMPISRVFYGGAVQQWPGNAGLSGRPVVVSFKYAPSEVLLGIDDSALSSFFAGAPTGYDVYWSYIHEPEDNIGRGEFTAAEYRAAWQHIADLASAAKNTRLHSTLILMCYTMNPASHRNWKDYYVASAQSLLAFDCYNHAGKQNTYGAPADIFKPVTDWSAANVGIPWGITEVGSTLSTNDTNGDQRATWLRQVGAFLANQRLAHGYAAIFGIYFDTVGPSGTDYRLTDAASRTAWADVVQTF